MCYSLKHSNPGKIKSVINVPLTRYGRDRTNDNFIALRDKVFEIFNMKHDKNIEYINIISGCGAEFKIRRTSENTPWQISSERINQAEERQTEYNKRWKRRYIKEKEILICS